MKKLNGMVLEFRTLSQVRHQIYWKLSKDPSVWRTITISSNLPQKQSSIQLQSKCNPRFLEVKKVLKIILTLIKFQKPATITQLTWKKSLTRRIERNNFRVREGNRPHLNIRKYNKECQMHTNPDQKYSFHNLIGVGIGNLYQSWTLRRIARINTGGRHWTAINLPLI